MFGAHLRPFVETVVSQLPTAVPDRWQLLDRRPETRSADGSTAATTTAEPDESPEEHVLRLCRTRGGRLKQSEVVTETGWSKTKVSRLLSRMEANGRIARVKVGREKVVGVPGTLPQPSAEAEAEAAN